MVTHPTLEQVQGKAFCPSFSSCRKTEFGTPGLHLVAGRARAAVLVLGRPPAEAARSSERLATAPRLRKRSRSSRASSAITDSCSRAAVRCCEEKNILSEKIST